MFSQFIIYQFFMLFYGHTICMIYLIIFIFKLIENTLSTFRLIVVAHGKKLSGAILQGIVTFVWAVSASLVIIDIKENNFKVFVFCLGSIVGSYLGSFLEERMHNKKVNLS